MGRQYAANVLLFVMKLLHIESQRKPQNQGSDYVDS